MSGLNPYEQLGVASDADAATIKKAYRRQARASHPDRNPDDPHAKTRFQLIQEAYEILSDPERRARYDNGGDPTKHVDTLAARAHALLAGTIIQVLKQADEQRAFENPSFQIVQALHSVLEQMRQGAATRKAGCERVRRGLEKQLKRFKYKGADGGNLIGDVMTEQMERAKVQAAKHEADVIEINATIDLLAQYEDLPPEDLFRDMQQRTQSSMRTSYGGVLADWIGS